MLNLTPILKEDQPTSHVKIGESKLDSSTDIVLISHNDRQAYFYVKQESDRVVDEIGNKVRMNQNVADLFGGIDRSRDFLVDPDASRRNVHSCRSATVYTAEPDTEALEEFLRSNEYLLHPIEEVVRRGDDLITFDVVEMEPSDYTTLRVDEDTEIEFLDAGEYRERQSSRSTQGRRPPAEADDGDEVSIHVSATKPTKNFEDDVAGLPEVKRTAEMLLALFDHETRSEVVDRFGPEFATRGDGMLLYGPPGCGKTLVSEAIAYEAKYNSNIEENYGEVKFLNVKGSDILSKYAGESEKRVEAVFERAHGIAQDGFAVLFFDEIETLVPDRSDDNLQRYERSLTNAFLQEMNDIEDNLLVIGATNMPFTIDPAASRRFPIQQFIPQPDESVMAEVWRKHLTSLPNADEIDFERLGQASTGYTPAEIADRVLGSDFQRELVESVIEPDREPITVDTEYLLDRLADTEPKTIRQYITSVRRQVSDLEGYPELRRYVEEQVEALDIESTVDGDLMEAYLSSMLDDEG